MSTSPSSATRCSDVIGHGPALGEAGKADRRHQPQPAIGRRDARSLPCRGDARHFGVELDHMDEASIASRFEEAVRLAGRVDSPGRQRP